MRAWMEPPTLRVSKAPTAGTDLDPLRTLSDADELPQLVKTTAFIQCLRALSQNG